MIIKFLKNFRIRVVVKHAEFLFNQLAHDEKAYVILMAAEQLLNAEKPPVYSEVLRSPQSFTPEECYHVYLAIEDIQLDLQKGMKKIEKTVVSQKGNSDPTKLKLYYIAIFFWLSKLATNINPKQKYNAERVCNILTKNFNGVDFDNDSLAAKTYTSIGKLYAERFPTPIHRYSLDRLRKVVFEILDI
jgi:hypothetical protein